MSKGKITEVVVADIFKVGDAVTILLGYSGTINQEFKGFVQSIGSNKPLELTCEGYSYLLSKTNISLSYKSVNVKQLFMDILSKTDAAYPITLHCAHDIRLSNVKLIGNGIEAIQQIVKATEGILSCAFTAYNTLWVGCLNKLLKENPTALAANTVTYKVGYNTLQGHMLKRSNSEPTTSVTLTKKNPNGTQVEKKVIAEGVIKMNSVVLNQIEEESDLDLLANEKYMQLNREGVTGTINTMLLPYVYPFYAVKLIEETTTQNPDIFLVESVETKFDIEGARRKVELGAKLKL